MSIKTTTPKLKDMTTKWHFIDADNIVLGKLATQIAKLLTGKDNVLFANNENMGSKVVITNAEKIAVTGNKMKDKVYYHYTGFPKGLRRQSLGEIFAKDPTEVIYKAVKGMLPNNKLLNIRLKNLYIYQGPEHPHKGQEKK